MCEECEDDLGRPVAVPERVRRVVSLVPSLTEAVAVSAPGLLVGATDWCVHPADLDALGAAGLPVWITGPRTLPGALASLDRILTIACRRPRPGWLDAAAAAWAVPYGGPRRRAVVPIWRRPWMALGRDTFAGDVLARLGVDNVLADHPDRYPRVDLSA